MKEQKNVKLDFEVDKLTESIENVHSGDRFITEISLLLKSEVTNLTKSNGWKFDWKTELHAPKQIL